MPPADAALPTSTRAPRPSGAAWLPPGAWPWSEAIAGLFGALGRLQGPLTVAGALGPGPTMDFSGIPTSRRIGPASGATQLRRVPAALPVLRGGSDGDSSKSVPTLSGPGTFPPHGFGGGSACHRRAVSLHRPQRLGVFGRRTLSGRGSWWSAYFDSVPAAGRCTPPGRHSVPGRRSLALEASIRERQRGKLRARGTAPGPSPRQEQWTYGFGGIPC